MKNSLENIKFIHAVNDSTAEMRHGVQQQWTSIPGYLFSPIRKPDVPVIDLFDLYSANQPAEWANDAPCITCREFIRSYGSLGYINAEGVLTSALWNEATVENPELKTLFKLMREAVEQQFVAAGYQLFFADQQVVGAETRNSFKHFHLDWVKFTNHGEKEYDPSTLANNAAHQKATALNLVRGFSKQQVKDVLTYFKSDADLVGSRAHVNILEELAEIVIWDAFVFLPQEKLELMAWKVAPYVRGDLSAVTSGILNVFFVESNMETAKLKYLERHDNAVYMKVQRDFTLRELRVAEKLLKESGLDKAIDRRSATLADVVKDAIVWRAKASSTGLGILGGIPVKKDKPNPAVSTNTITKHLSLRTFIDEFLPAITDLKMWVGNSYSYLAFTVPNDPTAPNILRADHDIAMWTFDKPFPTRDIGIPPNTYAEVEAVVDAGLMRYIDGKVPPDEAGHQGYHFVLKGAHMLFESTPAMFKSALSRDKFKYDQLANVLDKYTTEMKIPSPNDMMISHPLFLGTFENTNHPGYIISGLIDGVLTKFSIKSWK